MVKRSRVLEDEVGAEAPVPYEETPLAKRASRARRRLALVLAAGAILALARAALALSFGWVLVAAALAATAWGAREGRLGGVVSAALAALVAIMLALRVVFVGATDAPTLIQAGVAFAFGAACLPDVVTLLRDAELQHAYGLWARRE